MTGKDKTCEVCGHTDFFAGVASSGLAPMSCAWCHLCIGMGAEMRIVVEGTVENCGGIENINENVGLIYFDQQKDSYIDYRTNEIVPIKSSINEKQFNLRSDWFKWQEKLQRIVSCPYCEASVDITEWNMIDSHLCMSCHETFERNQTKGKIRFREIQ